MLRLINNDTRHRRDPIRVRPFNDVLAMLSQPQLVEALVARTKLTGTERITRLMLLSLTH